EHGGGHGGTLQRGHGLSQGVPHGDTALHRGHGGEHVHTGAVTGGVHTRDGCTRDPVDLDEITLAEAHTGFLQTEISGVGDHADRHQAVTALDDTTVGQGDLDAIAGVENGHDTCTAEHGHSTPHEDPLVNLGGVGFLGRQNEFT